MHWSPDTNGAGSQPVGPRAMAPAPNGGTLVVGGDFTTVNGTAQQGITRFVTGGDTATPVGARSQQQRRPVGTDTPIVVAMRMPVTVQPTKAGTLTVEFPASTTRTPGC